MSVYKKAIAQGSFEHGFYAALGFPPIADGAEAPLVLRVTLGNMGLLDGFYMSLPAEAAGVSITDVIRKYVLCESEEARRSIRQRIASDPNPDLLEIHDSLLWLYEQAEAGEVTLYYHINNGASDVSPTDTVEMHQQTCMTEDGCPYNLLDLVLEVYDNIDPFSLVTDEQRETMLRDFRGIFILYLMDRFGCQPGEDPYLEIQDVESADSLSSMLDYMASGEAGLICFEGDWRITPQGYGLLSNIIDEAEFYIDNYDIFGDVHVSRAGEITFNTGHGDNLIAPVFLRDGIDPYRAFFVTALYLGNLDHLVSDPTMLFSEEPFRQLFSVICYSPTVEDTGLTLLDRIIHEGKSKVEERQLREQRLKRMESIQRRIESDQ